MSEAYLGEIRMFSGNYAPVNWMLCDGALLPIAPYQALYALLGTRYGGDGVNNFRLPDLRGRAPISQGQGSGLSTYAAGNQGGVESIALTTDHMPSHNHTLKAATTATQPSPENGYWAPSLYTQYTKEVPNAAMGTGAVTMGGATAAHENMMPFMPVSYIICLQGYFPSRQ